MWTEAIDCWKYRPPYLPRFFQDVATRVGLRGTEDLLDLACGTGNVALGFAPYVASLTGVEPELGLIEEAKRRAHQIGRDIRLVHSKADDAPLDLGSFAFITIGMAHWYLHSPETLERIDRWLAPGGQVMICLPLETEVDNGRWFMEYTGIRRRWDRTRLFDRMGTTVEDFFAGTKFEQVEMVKTYGRQTIDIEHLVNRAFGYGSTSRSLLGEADAERMAAEIRAAMAPYFKGGTLVEHLCTGGVVFRRGDGM